MVDQQVTFRTLQVHIFATRAESTTGSSLSLAAISLNQAQYVEKQSNLLTLSQCNLSLKHWGSSLAHVLRLLNAPLWLLAYC